jgi:hypothetical protein
VNRLTSADKLSDADRKTILDLATRTLLPFQPAPQIKPEAKPDPKPAAQAKP